jgi:hypothetical protein
MSNLSFNQVHRFFQSQLKELTAPELSRCRQFYKVCPEILGTMSQELIRNITNGKTTKQILGSTTQELQSKDRLFISKYKLSFPSEQELKGCTYE